MRNRRFLLFGLLCCVCISLLAGCGSDTAAGATQNPVHMSSVDFAQPSITIKKGERVTLIADNLVPHVIANGTWDNGKAKAMRESGAPEVKDVQIGGNSQGSIGPFTSAGTFKLYCTIHQGMKLTVIVK